MAAIPSVSSGLRFDNTLGGLYIGNACASALFGITSIQVATYFSHSSKDRPVMRALVAFLWVLDLLHLIFNGHAFYTYSVTNFSNPLGLLSISWGIVAEMVVTVISDTIVQGVFTYRIWKLGNKNIPLVSAIVVMSTFVAVTGFMLAAKCVQTPFFLDADKYSTTLLFASLGGAAAADTAITISLCYFLSQKQSAIKRTQSLIKIIMVYTINAGALTSICALASLIAYATMNKNFIFLAIYSVLPKLYLNSLLATLNARWIFQSMKTSTSDHLSIPLSSVTPTHVNLSSQTAMSQPTINVHVDQVVEKFNQSFSDEHAKEQV